MAEQSCRVGDVDIAFETFGGPSDPALLLVMGLATQMIAWHEDFCTKLAGRGFHVIRFDNRDVGRSSAMRHLPVPTLRQLALRCHRLIWLNPHVGHEAYAPRAAGMAAALPHIDDLLSVRDLRSLSAFAHTLRRLPRTRGARGGAQRMAS